MSRRHSSSRSRKSSRRKGTPQYSTLTARQKATYDRTTNLITDLRSGEGSYTALLRAHHLGSRTARKYGGRDLIGTRGRPVRASKADKRVRILMFPKPGGDVPRHIRSSREATTISEFFQDRHTLLKGKMSAGDFEAKWLNVRIAGEELFADAAAIIEMADAGELKVDTLYASTSGPR